MRTRIFFVIVGILFGTLVWLIFAEHHIMRKSVDAGCTQEARMCPDGSSVGRIAPYCEFAECPVVPVEETAPNNTNSQNGAVACTMDAKICPDGSAVGRTAPNCEFAPCPPFVSDIIISTPLPQSTITSPVTILGTARGNWFFEGSFPISIVNWDGLIIGKGIAQAQGDWMTEDFVPFTATISYTLATGTKYNTGAIILKKDNPSSLPENNDSKEIPVAFGESEENVILSQ